MAEYKIPEAYTQFLDQLQENLTSKTALVDYQPRSDSTLKSAIAKALRPGYDQAIRTRQSQAATNRASIDADAAARGMGSSTWVTDAKNRQNDAAARDIADLEGDYSAQLYNSLLARMSEQDQLSMTAQQFNAQSRQNALAQALAGTDAWWEKWKKQQGSSGGSSSSSKKSSSGSSSASSTTKDPILQITPGGIKNTAPGAGSSTASPTGVKPTATGTKKTEEEKKKMGNGGR